MAYTVTIKYTGSAVGDGVREGYPICSVFMPTSSYIDSPVYKVGNPTMGETVGENYGKSLYATNVIGHGQIPLPTYWAETLIPLGVPLAQFHLSVIKDDVDESGHPYVEITVEDYKEAFYFQELGVSLADQGFTVEVVKN